MKPHRRAYNDAVSIAAALRAAITAMEYAEQYYLTPSAAGEMWAHCNGHAGSIDIRAALKAMEELR